MSQIISLQVGTPQTHSYETKSILTSMLKDQRVNSINLSENGFTGDQFANASIHGTEDSRVYAMAKSFYDYWRSEYGPQAEFGSVGENITTDVLDETQIFCGDQFSVGSAVIEATSPRFPCTKLNFVFKDDQAMQKFMHHKQPGVYFRVVRPGFLQIGDRLIPLLTRRSDLSIADIYQALFLRKTTAIVPADLVNKIMADPYVSSELIKARFQR